MTVQTTICAGTTVTVTVPATGANLGPGFDALGLALTLYDEVTVAVVGPGAPPLDVQVSGEGAPDVPRDESHLVVRALHAALAHRGEKPPRLALRCANRIPHGRGLGSSAAAAVAGVLLARGLLDSGRVDGRGDEPSIDDDAVLALVTELEGHPDNAAACLLGGLTIAWTDDHGPRAVRLEPAPDLRAHVLVPAAVLSTHTARGMLPPTVPHADAAHAAARAALLVEAVTRRPELLLVATEDRLHQPYRAPAMPETAALVEALRADGLAAVVSGAGPSVLVLGAGADPGRLAAPAGWRLLELSVSVSGARVSTSTDSAPDGGGSH